MEIQKCKIYYSRTIAPEGVTRLLLENQLLSLNLWNDLYQRLGKEMTAAGFSIVIFLLSFFVTLIILTLILLIVGTNFS